MSYRIAQNYYNELNEQSDHSDEGVVRWLWSAILNLYFTVAEDFGVEVQPRLAPAKRDEANDVTIVYIHHINNKRNALYLFDNKRIEHERQRAKWAIATEQFTSYMVARREAMKHKAEDMFGVVTVGRYSRFYVLKPGRTDLDIYPGTNDKYFEFKKAEQTIISILLAIKGVLSGPSMADGRETDSRPSSRGSDTASSPGSSTGSTTSRPGSCGKNQGF